MNWVKTAVWTHIHVYNGTSWQRWWRFLLSFYDCPVWELIMCEWHAEHPGFAISSYHPLARRKPSSQMKTRMKCRNAAVSSHHLTPGDVTPEAMHTDGIRSLQTPLEEVLAVRIEALLHSSQLSFLCVCVHVPEKWTCRHWSAEHQCVSCVCSHQNAGPNVSLCSYLSWTLDIKAFNGPLSVWRHCSIADL